MRRGPIKKDRAGPMRRGPSDERGPLRRGPLETHSGSLLERIRRGRAAVPPDLCGAPDGAPHVWPETSRFPATARAGPPSADAQWAEKNLERFRLGRFLPRRA